MSQSGLQCVQQQSSILIKKNLTLYEIMKCVGINNIQYKRRC